jgi:hypothetical protein
MHYFEFLRSVLTKNLEINFSFLRFFKIKKIKFDQIIFDRYFNQCPVPFQSMVSSSRLLDHHKSSSVQLLYWRCAGLENPTCSVNIGGFGHCCNG